MQVRGSVDASRRGENPAFGASPRPRTRMTTSRSVQFIDPDPKMAIAWPATRPCGLVTECIILKKTIAALDDLVLRHPRSVGETYCEHATIAIRFASGKLGRASCRDRGDQDG